VYDIEIYRTATNREPYTEWETSLDRQIRARIDARLARIRFTGNLGDFKSVHDGVFELRFDFGPGYRVYFGFDQMKSKLIILLAGGSKRHQAQDIAKAKEYWRDHLSHK
jgi:putative addiction module killer protein